MRFCQLSEITSLEPGERVQAILNLTGQEDYLRDHFPRFAVMPGVLMLEALFQASALLVRETEQYRSGLVMLKSVRNAKFADFVQPGQSLTIHAEIIKRVDDRYTLKAYGTKGDATAVSARLLVECSRTGDDGSTSAEDQFSANYMRQLTKRLRETSMA